MSNQTAPPTLDDVASRAGVSTATVSRYFNNPEILSKKAAARVEAAVRAIGYIPNMLAGGLASKRSRLVSVLVPHLSGAIFNDTIEAMITELSLAGSVVMLGLTGLDEDRTDAHIRAALGRRADAIIITGEVSAATRAMLRNSQSMVIEMWDLPADPIDIAVGFSHTEVGQEVARFCRTRGYVRPHLINTLGSRARLRRDGFVDEWAGLGGAAPSEDQVGIPSGFGKARGAFAAMRRLPTMPDVVLCGSDSLAQGMIVEANAAGLKIPDDLAVIGFGNNMLAGEMRPTITSVDIDGARIARECIRLLQQRADGVGISNRRIDVGFRLIARESG